MNDQDLEQFKAHITKLAKDLKSEADLGDLTQQLMNMTVEAALGAELGDHLGYDKHDPAGRGSGNSRNGTSSKRLKCQHGEIEIDTPRDRAGSRGAHREPSACVRSVCCSAPWFAAGGWRRADPGGAPPPRRR